MQLPVQLALAQHALAHYRSKQRLQQQPRCDPTRRCGKKTGTQQLQRSAARARESCQVEMSSDRRHMVSNRPSARCLYLPANSFHQICVCTALKHIILGQSGRAESSRLTLPRRWTSCSDSSIRKVPINDRSVRFPIRHRSQFRVKSRSQRSDGAIIRRYCDVNEMVSLLYSNSSRSQ